MMKQGELLIDENTGEIITPDDAWQRHRRIVDLRNVAEKTYLALGKELYWFHYHNQYKALGHETFEAYLADPDVDIKRRGAFRCMRIYQVFDLGYQCAPGALLQAGVEKLDVIATHVDETNVDEWVAKAASLSRSDLRKEIATAFPPSPPAPLPDGKYRIIYADPPWQYGNNMPDYFGEQGDHYALMSLEEICNLPVRELAGDNSVLFLWATSPILEESFQVVKAWGFQYKTSFVWDKVKHVMGHYNSVRHELLLVCTRGSCRPDVIELFDSVQTIERTNKHSEKPEEFRAIIDTIYPHGKRIELFARRNTNGWDTWGNELSTIPPRETSERVSART